MNRDERRLRAGLAAHAGWRPALELALPPRLFFTVVASFAADRQAGDGEHALFAAAAPALRDAIHETLGPGMMRAGRDDFGGPAGDLFHRPMFLDLDATRVAAQAGAEALDGLALNGEGQVAPARPMLPILDDAEQIGSRFGAESAGPLAGILEISGNAVLGQEGDDGVEAFPGGGVIGSRRLRDGDRDGFGCGVHMWPPGVIRKDRAGAGHGCRIRNSLTRIGGRRSFSVGGVEPSLKRSAARDLVSMRLFLRPDSVRCVPAMAGGRVIRLRPNNRACLQQVPTSRRQGGPWKAHLAVFVNAAEEGLNMADATPATIPSALNLSDIDTTVNHEPRIRDLRLAEVLGMVNLHSIRRLIQRHRAVLDGLGEVVSHHDAKPPTGGRPSSSFYLTKRQALFLTAKADTPRAAMVTVEMVEVFDQVTAGRPAPTVTDLGGRPLALTEQEIAVALSFRIQVERAIAAAVDTQVRERVRRNAVAAGIAIADIVCGDMVFDGASKRLVYRDHGGGG